MFRAWFRSLKYAWNVLWWVFQHLSTKITVLAIWAWIRQSCTLVNPFQQLGGKQDRINQGRLISLTHLGRIQSYRTMFIETVYCEQQLVLDCFVMVANFANESLIVLLSACLWTCFGWAYLSIVYACRETQFMFFTSRYVAIATLQDCSEQVICSCSGNMIFDHVLEHEIQPSWNIIMFRVLHGRLFGGLAIWAVVLGTHPAETHHM